MWGIGVDELLHLVEKKLKVNAFGGKESQFSLRVWHMVGHYTIVIVPTPLSICTEQIAISGIYKIKEHDVKMNSERDVYLERIRRRSEVQIHITL